jgi:hypothetical protein
MGCGEDKGVCISTTEANKISFRVKGKRIPPLDSDSTPTTLPQARKAFWRRSVYLSLERLLVATQQYPLPSPLAKCIWKKLLTKLKASIYQDTDPGPWQRRRHSAWYKVDGTVPADRGRWEYSSVIEDTGHVTQNEELPRSACRKQGSWLFNNALSISDYTASNKWMTVHNELGRLWKEAVMA